MIVSGVTNYFVLFHLFVSLLDPTTILTYRSILVSIKPKRSGPSFPSPRQIFSNIPHARIENSIPIFGSFLIYTSFSFFFFITIISQSFFVFPILPVCLSISPLDFISPHSPFYFFKPIDSAPSFSSPFPGIKAKFLSHNFS